MYGRYDELVIELRGLDALRAGRRELRLPINEIESVSLAPRELEVGVERAGPRSKPAVLIRTSRRVVAVHRPDAAEMAEDLARRGVGRPAVGV